MIIRRTVRTTDLVVAAAVVFQLCCVSCVLGDTNEKAKAVRKPNIVVVLADDMGIDAFGRFNEALPEGVTYTPRLDELSKHGMSFSDAHSGSAVCSPTRYGMLTGRYAWRGRLKAGIVSGWGTPLLEDERLTLPEMLKAKGYETICVGKWHLGWDWRLASGEPLCDSRTNFQGKVDNERIAKIDFSKPVSGGPLSHGFDRYIGDGCINNEPHSWFEDDRLTGKLDEYGNSEEWNRHDVLPRIASETVKYIHQAKDSDDPFFVYMPLSSPHSPVIPSAAFRGKTPTILADFILETDHVLGQVVDALKESGQLDDTLLIFTADNGTCLMGKRVQDNQVTQLMANWRGVKSHVWEGGHRVPFVAHWPGVIEADTTCDHLICLTDLMATFADVVGYDLPETAGEDSHSLLPLLKGGKLEKWPVVNHSAYGFFAIRDGKWKLVFCSGSGGFGGTGDKGLKLYDLEADPMEEIDVQDQHPEVVKKMTELLKTLIKTGRSTPGAPSDFVKVSELENWPFRGGVKSKWPYLPFALEDIKK